MSRTVKYRSSLYVDSCFTTVDTYKHMKQRGDRDEDVALCILHQLRELEPACERYRKIFFWAWQSLDGGALERYGFGLTQHLPFPVGMHNRRFCNSRGKAQQLCCFSDDDSQIRRGEYEEG